MGPRVLLLRIGRVRRRDRGLRRCVLTGEGAFPRDLEEQPEAMVASLCKFLGLEGAHPLEFQARYNQSKVKAVPRPHHRLLRRMTDDLPRDVGSGARGPGPRSSVR